MYNSRQRGASLVFNLKRLRLVVPTHLEQRVPEQRVPPSLKMEIPGDLNPVTKQPHDTAAVSMQQSVSSKAATQGLRSTKSAQSKAYRKDESLPSANQYTKNTPLPEYRSDLALFKALFTWHGTIFPLVACSTAFWALWASHGVFIVLKKFNVFLMPDNDDETAEVTWSVITVPTSLMVFFLVRPTA